KKGAKVSVASAYFSLFAYDALKIVLDNVDSFNFIYTKPTFIREDNDLKRQYTLHIPESEFPKFDGNRFEIQLSNKMMSNAIAQRITKWINEKATFKSINSDVNIPKQLSIQNNGGGDILVQSELDFTAD